MAKYQREQFSEDEPFERLWDSDSAELDDSQLNLAEFDEDEDFQIQMDNGGFLEFDDDY